jgi:hypothetical protein
VENVPRLRVSNQSPAEVSRYLSNVRCGSKGDKKGLLLATVGFESSVQIGAGAEPGLRGRVNIASNVFVTRLRLALIRDLPATHPQTGFARLRPPPNKSKA